MPDLEQIIEDLIKMRGATSQRQLGKEIGVSYATIRAIEKGETKSLKVSVLARWLEWKGSSMAVYFSQVAAAQELKAIARDKELVEQIRRALIHPDKRRQLKAVLNAMLAGEPHDRGNQ